MIKRHFIGVFVGGFAFAAICSVADAGHPSPPRKPDLGDVVQGVYAGNVISDSKGSSKSDVAITIARVGKNLVQVTSDYDRLPVVTVHLTRALGKIENGGGNTVFFFDPSKAPPHLDLSFNNEVSWAGEKR